MSVKLDRLLYFSKAQQKQAVPLAHWAKSIKSLPLYILTTHSFLLNLLFLLQGAVHESIFSATVFK